MNTSLNTATVKTLLEPIFEKHGVHKAVLFGSVAKGTNRTGSDIDILVDSRLKGLRFVGLLEDVKNAINVEVDLFDVTHIKRGSAVENEITRTGVVIYEKS